MPTDAELRARFRAERSGFEALRRAILVEPVLFEIRRDALVWTEPCEWKHGCQRWVDGRPTAAALARVGRMSERRAQTYLDGLDHLGALVVVRDARRDRVDFWMHVQGIVPSGASKSIVWSATPESDRALLVADTAEGPPSAHGHRVAPLDDEWRIELEWN